MLRHLLLGLTFVTAFTFAGVGLTEKADAWRAWGRPYAAYYGAAPRTYYYNGYAPTYAPYGTYYRGYAPYRAYYPGPTYYRSYQGYYQPNYYYYGQRPGVAVSFGY
jgi:hypothetical protein